MKLSEHAIFLPTNNEWAPSVIMGLQMHSLLLKDRDTRGDFSGMEFRRAMEKFHEFFTEGLAPVKTTQIINLYQAFAENQFAMYISGPWNIGEFSRRLPTELQSSWMTAPLPGPDGGIGLSLAGGSSLVMLRTSTRKSEVWKLIEFLSAPVQQLQFYRLTGNLPARVEAWRDSALVHNRYARAFFTQLNHVIPTPKVPEWEQIAQKEREYSELIAMGTMSVEEAMTALDRDVNVMLEKRRWMIYGR
jgi:multiple sugar transport system substrate-binding protein